jgi:membrane protease YdiL (CAAX protease family)
MGAVVLGGVTREISPARLSAWALFVVTLGAVNLAVRQSEGTPEPDILYKYDVAVSNAVFYVILLGVLLLIARGLDWRAVFALHRPPSLAAAAGWAAAGLAAIVAAESVLAQFLDAGKDQGIVPKHWEPSHAGAFVANFLVIAVLAPIVEELIFRGFGVTAIRSFVSSAATVLWVGIAFGVWHGLVIAFPALATLGAILAVVRLRTRSVYPTMVMHALFNGVTLILAVTVGVGS